MLEVEGGNEVLLPQDRDLSALLHTHTHTHYYHVLVRLDYVEKILATARSAREINIVMIIRL